MKITARSKLVSIILVSIIALGLGLWAALELGLKQLIKEQIIISIEQRLSQNKLEIGDLSFSLINIFRLNPVLEIEDISLGSDFKAPKIQIALELWPLLSRQINIKTIQIHKASLKLKPPKQSEIIIPELNAEISNIKSNEQADLRIWTNIYGSSRSVFNYEGKLGPIPDLDQLAKIHSLGLSGKAELHLYFSDLPLALRQKSFGTLLLSPQNNDQISMQAEVEGDIFGDIKAHGQAKLDRVRLGKNNTRHMIASAQMPFNLIINALQKQKAQLYLNHNRLILKANRGYKSSGELNLDAVFNNNLITGFTSGSINGRLDAIDLNEFISSFSPTEDTIYGVLKVPSFRLHLSGITNAEQMQSLTGSGTLSIDEVSSPILDKILNIKDLQQQQFSPELLKAYAEALANGSSASKTLAKLNSSFNISDAKFYTPDLIIQSHLAQIHGGGFFNYRPILKQNDKAPHLNYDLRLSLGKFAPIPLKIRGTSAKPKIKADIQSFAVSTGQDIIKQIIYQKYLQSQGANGEVENPPAEIIPSKFLDKLIRKL